MPNLFVSNDLNTGSSGDIVCQQELNALEEFSKDREEEVIKIDHNDINPLLYNLPDSPFFQDYLAINRVSELILKLKSKKESKKESKIKIAHFYGAPFKSTINYLKAHNIITTNTVAAHDRRESVNEFGNLGIPYPFNHISDDLLWNMYFGIGDADVIIVPSNLSKSVLEKEGCKQNIQVIPHGVDIPDPKDIKQIGELSKGMLNSEFTVGYIGQYGPDKGVRYLIEAWSQLNYQEGNSILILGGTQANRNLEPFIRKYSSGGKFNLLGWIENIHTFYNLASIYVQPSVTEGWGMEVLEAASHGRPVIVSDGCGAKDYVKDGDNGFIVNKRDPKAIAEKIDWFKTHQQEMYIMSGHNKQMSKKYDWKIIREKYINVWNSL